MKRRYFLGAGLACAFSGVTRAAPVGPRPGPRDLCPVCGMLVSKYPHWVSAMVWDDGALFFDGAKDLFKAWLDPARYLRSRRIADVRSVEVTDFYSLERIDARRAFFVIGSDVLGPMGHELVAFSSDADAQAFFTEHRATRILRFAEVNRDLLRLLDAR